MEMEKLDSYFLKIDNFQLIHLTVEKLDLFNFHPIFLGSGIPELKNQVDKPSYG